MLTVEKLQQIAANLKERKRLANVTLNGVEYYVMEVHPRWLYLLKVSLARDKYKHEQWVKRYNKWRANRSEPPYQETEGEVGTFEGVRFKGPA